MLGFHQFRLCGILVIQIKPQLEKVLKLPEDGLTKEPEKKHVKHEDFHCDWMVEQFGPYTLED